MPKPITRNAIESLLSWRGPAGVSLYVPTHRLGKETRQDPIQLKNLVNQAIERLSAAGEAEESARRRLAPVEALIDDLEFWKRQDKGLAIFLGDGTPRIYSLPIEVEPLVDLRERFYVKPLLSLLEEGQRFFILAISQNDVRLISATPEAAELVDLRQTPTSLEEAMKFDDPEKHLEFHTRTSTRDPMGARSAEFHGQGTGSDDARIKKKITEFCRMVADGVADRLADADEPLILAGTEPTVSIYRQVNRAATLHEQTIQGNPDRKDPETLRQEAMEVLKPDLETRQQEALNTFGRMSGQGKVASGVENVLNAAVNGQIDLLLMPRNEHLWGRYEAEGSKLETHASREEGDEDLLDLAAAETCRHGGSVRAIDAGKIPGQGKLAATLRFST
ncbi:MAG: hypothetical protein ACLFUJ_11225 [Phycisphaerae bacterium]